MKTSTILALTLVAALNAPALAGSCAGLYHPASASARDRLLATPAPYAQNRVTSHTQNAGTPYHQGRRYADRASSVYGAPTHTRVIYARRDHQIIALSPWCDLRGASRIGFDDVERARTLWLRENGLVLGVRSHTNPRHHHAEQLASSEPNPRATIRRHFEVRTPQAPVASAPARFIGAVTTDEIRARLALDTPETDAATLAEADRADATID